jgi:hypothetical protein
VRPAGTLTCFFRLFKKSSIFCALKREKAKGKGKCLSPSFYIMSVNVKNKSALKEIRK